MMSSMILSLSHRRVGFPPPGQKEGIRMDGGSPASGKVGPTIWQGALLMSLTIHMWIPALVSHAMLKPLSFSDTSGNHQEHPLPYKIHTPLCAMDGYSATMERSSTKKSSPRENILLKGKQTARRSSSFSLRGSGIRKGGPPCPLYAWGWKNCENSQGFPP